MSAVDEIFRRGLAALQSGKPDEAERALKKVLDKNPRHVGALNILGIIMMQTGRLIEAERYMRRALAENATSDATFYNHGVVLKALERPTEALESLNKAIAINPGVADTWNNRGTVYNDLRRYDEAIADFDRAIALNPQHSGAFCNKGKSQAEQGLLKQALEAFNRSNAINSRLVESWVGIGNVLVQLGRPQEALAAYDKAIAINPNFALALYGAGNALGKMGRYEDAVAAYDKAAALDPELKYLKGARIHAKQHICDWKNLQQDIDRLLADIRKKSAAVVPFQTFAMPATAADQLQCARRYATEQPAFPPLWRCETYRHERIRLAYLSADFHDHPVAQLIVSVLEQHNRQRFDIAAISLGPDQPSDVRSRIVNAVGPTRFFDMRAKSDSEVAQAIHGMEIDIAIDLGGYTANSRHGVLARRAAPIQVSYLGYAGTMGAKHIDYLLADKTVVPEASAGLYCEKLAWLPDSYMAGDPLRRIAPDGPTRAACGLPQTGFVFCCFSNTFKITPEVFQVWMRLLRAVDGSVLWLAGKAPAAAENLRHAAEAAGVSQQRLVFATRVPDLADHLARHRHADLFLDTLPYNAHATAIDALWAGLPVLACTGETFASRVSASLLKAAGLVELVTASVEEYEALALKLAREPGLLATYRERLARLRTRCPLFDTARFVRHVEAAYSAMYERHSRGEPPEAITVPSS